MIMEKYSKYAEDIFPTAFMSSQSTGMNRSVNRCSKASFNPSNLCQKTCKRSFDIAFLTSPHETSKRNYIELSTNKFINDLRKKTVLLKSSDNIICSNHVKCNPIISSKDPWSEERVNSTNNLASESSRTDVLQCNTDLCAINETDLITRTASNSCQLSAHADTLNIGYIHDVEANIHKRIRSSQLFLRDVQAFKISANENYEHQLNRNINFNSTNLTYNDILGINNRMSDAKSAFTKVSVSVRENENVKINSMPKNHTTKQFTFPIGPPFLLDSAVYNSNMASSSSKYPPPLSIKMNQSFIVQPDMQRSVIDDITISQFLDPSKTNRNDIPPAEFLYEFPYSFSSDISCNPTKWSAILHSVTNTPKKYPFFGEFSSYASLILSTQNVCAECNLSFRMTSDLVYHMRSRHKNENIADNLKPRREEKLRCLVCEETFREKHHLTRHMTAHQDKDSDIISTVLNIKKSILTEQSNNIK